MRIALMVLLTACAMASASCDRKPTASTPAATYITRGRIEGVVRAPGVEPMVRVHHEAIPEFKDKAGAVIGMKEMVMEFPAAAEAVFVGWGPGEKPGAGLSPGAGLNPGIDGLKSGDLAEIQFAVDWSKVPYHRATRFTKLPEGTVLKLGSFQDDAVRK